MKSLTDVPGTTLGPTAAPTPVQSTATVTPTGSGTGTITITIPSFADGDAYGFTITYRRAKRTVSGQRHRLGDRHNSGPVPVPVPVPVPATCAGCRSDAGNDVERCAGWDHRQLGQVGIVEADASV